MPPPILPISLPDGFTFDLVFVEGGEFSMGDDNGEYDDEKPAHRVRLSSFYIGKLPVTQGLWQAVTGSNPSSFKGEKRPVEQVSWDDAQVFLEKLNAFDEVKRQIHSLKPPADKFRLPTEAEWEFAARGGNLSQGYAFSGSDKLRQVGWHDKNSGSETHDAGLLFPNELGIHDMSGNVREWCNDWFDEKYYEECLKKGVVENPPGADRGDLRVLRGGSCLLEPLYCRPAYRYDYSPDYRGFNLGFRLVLPFQGGG